MAKLRLDLVMQVCIAVRDVEKALEEWKKLFDVDEETVRFSNSWEAFERGDLTPMKYFGVEGRYRYRQLNFHCAGLDIEMFQPLDAEERGNPVSDFLREHGLGIHHVSIRLANREEGLGYLRETLGITLEVGSRVVGPRALMSKEELAVVLRAWRSPREHFARVTRGGKSMKMVQTATGRVSTAELGSVLMHEHLFSSSMGIATHYPQFYIDGMYDIVEAELKKIRAEGILTVVDAAPVCLGRDVRGLKRVSEDTGVNVIATTGWWGVQPPYAGNYPAEKYAQGFVDDIRVGCDGADIKAGIIKAAMDKDGPTEWRKTIHYAAGMASVETGASIFLHTYCPTETPRHQLRMLKKVGVDMNKVVVDHIPETTDMDFIRWIYDQGV